MSVQRAQFEIPSTEFLEWIAYLDADEDKFHREDYYLANIAAEIRRSYVKDPMKVRTDSFLMKFKKDRKPRKKKKLSIKERTKRAKAFWGAVLKLPSSRRKK